MSCPFCKDLEKQGTLIYKGKFAIVAINLHSLKKGHLMILPIRHVEKYNELTKEESKEMFDYVEFFSDVLKKCYGDFPIITINPIDGRSLPHVHLHLIPTKKYTRAYISKVDGTPERVKLTKDEINEIKKEMSKHL